MSDIKVVAFDSDIKALGDLIRKRSKAEKELVFPRDFIEEIPKMEDYLEDYLTGQLREYTCNETYIPDHFLYGCESIEQLNLPKAESMSRTALQDCINLKKVVMPKMKTLPNYAFSGCNHIEEIEMPLITKLPDSCFQDCLETDFSKMDFSNIKIIEEDCFYGCKGLIEIDLSNVQSMEDDIFENCINLQRVTYPALLYYVRHRCFNGCISLQNFDFSNIKLVEYEAFRNCTSLNKVILPVIQTLEYGCFYGCSNLNTVIIQQNASICDLEDIDAFSETPIANGEGFIYVPDELLEDYRAATNWSTYAEQIKPLSEFTEV